MPPSNPSDTVVNSRTALKKHGPLPGTGRVVTRLKNDVGPVEGLLPR